MMSSTEELGWSRPLRPGLAIATSSERAGSLGSVVFDGTTKAPLLLSVQHVLFEPRTDGLVWQPAPCGEPGCECNVVARAARGKRSVVPFEDQYYYVDAGVAALEPDVEWTEAVPGSARAATAMSVQKVGPASGVTRGVIVDTQHVERVRFGPVLLEVPNQIRIQPEGERPFAARGDSGALVCDEAGRAVAMLWGTDGAGRGVACPIEPVLDQLNIVFEEQR